MIKKPIITLCVLAYNRPRDLENTIKSFLWQDYKNSEMVIIDDMSPINLEPIVSRWRKKDRRIKYFRNNKNLGYCKNFNRALNLCRGKYIIFLGDDDIFLTKSSLKLYIKAFSFKDVALVRSNQILFKNFQIDQATKISDKKEISVFRKGKDALENVWIDTTSVAGFGLSNNKKIREMISTKETLYPQLELAGKISLVHNAAVINKYLIGVQSHEKQLNPIRYKLENKTTDIIDDMISVYFRINQFADRNLERNYSFSKYCETVTSSLLLFLPYSSIKNGRLYTSVFILKMLKLNIKLIYNVLFLSALLIYLQPKIAVIKYLSIFKKYNLKNRFSKKEINLINAVLDKYKY